MSARISPCAPSILVCSDTRPPRLLSPIPCPHCSCILLHLRCPSDTSGIPPHSLSPNTPPASSSPRSFLLAGRRLCNAVSLGLEHRDMRVGDDVGRARLLLRRRSCRLPLLLHAPLPPPQEAPLGWSSQPLRQGLLLLLLLLLLLAQGCLHNGATLLPQLVRAEV